MGEYVYRKLQNVQKWLCMGVSTHEEEQSVFKKEPQKDICYCGWIY